MCVVTWAGKPVHVLVAGGIEQLGSKLLVFGSRPLPSSPLGATRDIVSEMRPCRTATVGCCQMRLPQPTKPPCSVFGPLLIGSVYVVPLSLNEAPPIRLAYRPMVSPKYGPPKFGDVGGGLSRSTYSFSVLKPSATFLMWPCRSGTLIDCTVAP